MFEDHLKPLISFLITCRLKDNDFVGGEELFEGVDRRHLLATSWECLIEFAFLDKLANDVKSSLELPIDIHLRERGPLSIELKPLSNPFVPKDVESFDIAVLFWSECLDETPRKFALRSIQCALDKHHKGVDLHEVVNLPER